MALEVVLQDLLRALRIARLRVECRARVVRHHAVPTPKWILHIPPRVVLRCRLDVPHITCVSVELAGFHGVGDGVFVADCAAGGVDEPGAFLEVFEEVGVDEVTGAFV